MTVRLDGRVAAVTGAGSGLGREHALLLARLGACLVVNDTGGSVDGRGGAQAAADTVVDEIRAMGGKAAANYGSVSDREGAASIVETAISAFGRIDILVNNAGILRDKSFLKMELDEFEAVLAVHLLGTAFCTKAAWPYMMAQQYGRVIVTTSVAGTNGNFGQANYGAAKMGVLGLMNCLAIEGQRKNVLVNAVSPGALTRMTQGLTDEDNTLGRMLKPRYVSPMVGFLASEDCTLTGHIFTAAAGGFARLQFVETGGVLFAPPDDATPDLIEQHLSQIVDLANALPAVPGPEGFTAKRLAAEPEFAKRLVAS